MLQLKDRSPSKKRIGRTVIAIALAGVASVAVPVQASLVSAHTAAPTFTIAFVAGPSKALRLYTVNSDGSGLRTLMRGEAESLSLSPDGRSIAFERLAATGAAYRRDVYVVRADGSGVQKRLFDAEDPSWAPDGRLVAFERWHGHQAQIWTVTADGRHPRALPQIDVSDHDVAWSPDGKRIAFERVSLDPDRTHVLVMNAGGTGQRRLVHGRQTGRPAWSPDGRSIAFVGWIDHGLYVANADGSRMRRLARDVRILSSPVEWSPDGSEILFTRLQPRSWDFEDLYAIGVDGQHMRLIAEDVRSEGSWSRDGRNVLFWLNGGLHVVGADGRGMRRIATDARDGAWAGDGRTVLFTRQDGIYTVKANGTGERRIVRAANPHSLASPP